MRPNVAICKNVVLLGGFFFVFFLEAYLLVALAWVGRRLIAVRAAPAWLTMANGAKSGVRLTDSMQTVNLSTRLTARHHTRLHLGLGEVLQFVVDVQVLDASMEAGTVLNVPCAWSYGRVHINRHAWHSKRKEQGSMIKSLV